MEKFINFISQWWWVLPIIVAIIAYKFVLRFFLFLKKNKEKIRTHLGILFLMGMSLFLVLSPKTLDGQGFVAFIVFLWGLVKIREAMGKDGRMKPLDETDFVKKLKE